MKRNKFLIGCSVAVLILVGVITIVFYVMQKGFNEHKLWHDCRQNCWLIDDAKAIYAEKKSLTTGTIVTWQDIQPFFTNSQYWGWQVPNPTGTPQCPAGGHYTLTPVGSCSLCSIPYHQWENCKKKDAGGHGWR